MVRVAAYVDGFNLYFGLKAKYGRKYLWLDLRALAASLLRPGQTLEQITYFTARVRNDPEGQRRQSDYLDALASHSSRDVRRGRAIPGETPPVPGLRSNVDGVRGGDRCQHCRRVELVLSQSSG